MKKRSIKNLKLNKKSISNFEQKKVVGAGTQRCTGSWCWILLNEGPCPK